LILEVCCENIESAIIASKNGADRIELCSSLVTGGLSPNPSTIKILKEEIETPIMVLIRPRAGNFFYSELEKSQMFNEIELSLQAGADGIVIGALTEKFEVDVNFIQQALSLCDNYSTTFHRAFDFVKNPLKELEKLIDLGINRILSSGGANSAFEGKDLLKKLIIAANNQIEIMPGAGINSSNIKIIIDELSPNEIHLSAKKLVQHTNSKAPFNVDYFITDDIELKNIKAIIEDE